MTSPRTSSYTTRASRATGSRPSPRVPRSSTTRSRAPRARTPRTSARSKRLRFSGRPASAGRSSLNAHPAADGLVVRLPRAPHELRPLIDAGGALVVVARVQRVDDRHGAARRGRLQPVQVERAAAGHHAEHRLEPVALTVVL